MFAAVWAIAGCSAIFPLEQPDSTGSCSDAGCPPGQVCVDGVCAGSCLDADCPEGTACSHGDCVDETLDEDGDGTPARDDCDDRDPDVGPGSTYPCEGACGSGLRTCAAGRWSDCSAPTDCECTPGETRSEDCGLCGDAERSCNGDGRWGDLGPCDGQGECEPGDSGEQSCGNCGRLSRTCDEGCRWSTWSACEGEGACSPGATEDRACDDCSSEVRSCGLDCRWGDWSECGAGCAPGDIREVPCARCGRATSTCGANCLWGPALECEDQGICEPGDVETLMCPGEDVDHQRTCNGECEWGEWSLCPTCEPGETERASCGSCGQSTRTCQEDGTWGPAGQCTGEGACHPGDLVVCECGGQLVCNKDCSWPCPCTCGNDYTDVNAICEDQDAIVDRLDCFSVDPPCIELHCGPGCAREWGDCIACPG